MKTMTDLEVIRKYRLEQLYYMSVHGHTAARMHKAEMIKYKGELESRGIDPETIPTWKEINNQ